RGDSVLPMKIGIANVLLNVGLNLALRPVLGVAGIALSTTLTFMLLVGVSALVAQRRWRAIDIAELRDVGARAAISTAAIAGAGGVAPARWGRDADLPRRPGARCARASRLSRRIRHAGGPARPDRRHRGDRQASL